MKTKTENKVNNLEELVYNYIKESQADRKQRTIEMREFKNEMGEFKNEMSEFKDEMSEFKEETRNYIANMEIDRKIKEKQDKKFKENLENDRKKEHKEWNKKWGELANKLGSVVEDIMVPGIDNVIKRCFKDEITDLAVKRRIKDKSKLYFSHEYDIIAANDKIVYLVEVKASPRVQYLHTFIKNIEQFKPLFHEHKNKKIIPIMASLYMNKEVRKEANKLKIFLMTYREWDYLDIININEF